MRFIRTAINGDMTMTDRPKVVRTLMAPDNIEAAFVIAQSLDGTKRALLDQFRANLDSAASQLGYNVRWNLDNWNRGAGFYIRRQASDRFAVSFEFESNNLTSFMWGLSDTFLTQGSKDFVLTATVMTDEFESARTSPNWPWYSPPNDASLRAELSHWDRAAAPWQQMASGELQSAVLEKAERVFNAFAAHESLLAASAHALVAAKGAGSSVLDQ